MSDDKKEIHDLLHRLEEADKEIKRLSAAKALVQEERDKLRARNAYLENSTKQELQIRHALLVLVGVLKHDVAHLHGMGADEALPSEQFSTEALRVLDKLHAAFQFAEEEIPDGPV